MTLSGCMSPFQETPCDGIGIMPVHARPSLCGTYCDPTVICTFCSRTPDRIGQLPTTSAIVCIDWANVFRILSNVAVSATSLSENWVDRFSRRAGARALHDVFGGTGATQTALCRLLSEAIALPVDYSDVDHVCTGSDQRNDTVASARSRSRLDRSGRCGVSGQAFGSVRASGREHPRCGVGARSA